jgi:hypothetical protein
MLFSRKRWRPPGPKGLKKELIEAVVELKRRNLNWGCLRIAQPPTWRPSYSISNIIIMSIERTPDAKGTRR